MQVSPALPGLPGQSQSVSENPVPMQDLPEAHASTTTNVHQESAEKRHHLVKENQSSKAISDRRPSTREGSSDLSLGVKSSTGLVNENIISNSTSEARLKSVYQENNPMESRHDDSSIQYLFEQ